ncbi:Carboxylesterase [Kockiozyma suomiensis]|uniref:Carboxylesterase n=1 Tax=Kockiozyma suomiensis TaxID=1337062 RepID=UPI0033441072
MLVFLCILVLLDNILRLAGQSISSTESSHSFYSTTNNNTSISDTERNATSSLPVIDLGYARHRASSYNIPGDYFIFRNIRFAAPPTGSLRFQAPHAPLEEEGINDGAVGGLCFQAFNKQFRFVGYTQIGKRQSEDCLFLDLYVPGSVFSGSMNFSDSTLQLSEENEKLPIMVWIYGGGYTFGFKDGVYNPHGLLRASRNKMIYAAINYRVGVFGFLPPTPEKRSATNVGLLDQRMALDWISENIHLFGGDGKKITVLGESAGGSSIIHHLTAPGDHVPFQRAIIQSTAYLPQYDSAMLETQYNNFLKTAGCADSKTDGFDCLVNLDESILAKANKDYVLTADWGTFRFGPYIDNEYVPDLPQFRLRLGENIGRDEIQIMNGFNPHEGAIFVDPRLFTESQADLLISRTFPNASKESIEYAKSLYPKRKSVWIWANEIIAEWVVSCYSLYLDAAYATVYIYNFAIPPGTHSVDLPFTFWPGSENIGDTPAGSLSEDFRKQGYPNDWMDKIAHSFQEYLASFAVYGNPNTLSTSGVEFPSTKDRDIRTMLQVTLHGFKEVYIAKEGPSSASCQFWQREWWTGRETFNETAVYDS